MMSVSTHQHRSTAALLLASTLMLLPGVSSAHGDRVCANETISGGVFKNIRIDAGAWCTLENVIVKDRINAVNTTGVEMIGVTVGKEVHITGSTGNIDIRGSTFRSKLEITNNYVDGDINVVGDNSIGGDLVVRNNSAAGFLIGSRVSGGNQVRGKLQVERNQAKFFIAANNNLVWGDIRVSRNDAGEDISAWQNNVQGSIHYESNKSSDDVLPQFFNSVLLNNVGKKIIIQKNTTIAPIVAAGNIVGEKFECRSNMGFNHESLLIDRSPVELEDGTKVGENVILGKVKCEFADDELADH
jgi:hypothetical protein